MKTINEHFREINKTESDLSMAVEVNNVITAYKGFDSRMCCKGFQYEVGKEYELPKGEKPSVCNKGFHACESPLEVLDYYFMDDNANLSRFCEVEQSGDFSKEDNSTIVASSKIKIKAEIKFTDLIKLGVEWMKEKTSPEKVGSTEKPLSDSGYAQIGSSGYSAQIGSSGYYAKINSTGEDSVIMCAGRDSIVKAKKGSWITLAEWYRDEKSNHWKPKCVKTEFVDGEKIKEDTWYRLVNGEFVEVSSVETM